MYAIRSYYEKERPIEIVSLIAHGDPEGGYVLLHDPNHPKSPYKPGVPTSADELARCFRGGGVEVALLWTCHGARHHPVRGSVAARLLHPDGANLSAVVTSHAALRARHGRVITSYSIHYTKLYEPPWAVVRTLLSSCVATQKQQRSPDWAWQ